MTRGMFLLRLADMGTFRSAPDPPLVSLKAVRTEFLVPHDFSLRVRVEALISRDLIRT